MLFLPYIHKPDQPVSLPVETPSGLLQGSDRISRERVTVGAVSHDRARILSIGDDPILLYSRRLVLERDGYLVASLSSEAIIDDAQLRGFDLVILCHSIPDRVAAHILEVLWRQTPETPVLQVSRLDIPVCAGPHQIAVSAHPVAMLDAVAQQLAVHRNPGVRGKS